MLVVDAASVQRVARRYLDWHRAIIATVKPEEVTPGAAERKKGVKRTPRKTIPAKVGARKRKTR